MPAPDRGPVGPSGTYFLWFGSTALTLVALTLILVLGVLPRRYVLNSGLRESGVNFPTTRTPFTPASEARRAPAPYAPPQAAPPPLAAEPVPGPAERLWREVDALRAADRVAATLPLFETYLRDHPGDDGAGREYALALQAAGRRGEAVPVMEALLARREDGDLRLVLARMLRDLDRLDEADLHYALLERRNPDDAGLLLEWARAHAWARRYSEAELLLTRGRAAHPGNREFEAELARIYFQWDRLEAASAILEGFDDETLDRLGARDLRGGIREALAAPGTPEPDEEDSTDPVGDAERAVAAGRWDEAARAFEAALAEDSSRSEVWVAYADVLQFRLDDLPGARRALLEAEALDSEGALAAPRDRVYRLAQLAAWTADLGEAERRLEVLLAEEAPASGVVPQPAEVRAFLGDVRRWDGRRLDAVAAYEAALEEAPDNERARIGLQVVRDQVRDQLWAAERPRLGADASTLADSDEFLQVELGAVGVRQEGRWSLRTRTGTRWLQGRDLAGGTDRLRGAFVEVEPAVWWRWGTIRTGLLVGWENVRPDGSDLFAGASVRVAGLAGLHADLRYDHGPAYVQTTTLESALAGVDRDRLSAVLRRSLTPRTDLTLALDVSRFEPDATRVALDGVTARLEAAATLMREINPWLDGGIDLRALRFTDEAPLVDGRPLFWDPRRVWAAGVVLRADAPLAERWGMNATLRSGFATLEERRRASAQVVPHITVELGLLHRGDRIRTEVGAFFLQSRFDGYRSAGLRIGLSAVTGGTPGGTP